MYVRLLKSLQRTKILRRCRFPVLKAQKLKFNYISNISNPANLLHCESIYSQNSGCDTPVLSVKLKLWFPLSSPKSILN